MDDAELDRATFIWAPNPSSADYPGSPYPGTVMKWETCGFPLYDQPPPAVRLSGGISTSQKGDIPTCFTYCRMT
jgi:hypothetical protein